MTPPTSRWRLPKNWGFALKNGLGLTHVHDGGLTPIPFNTYSSSLREYIPFVTDRDWEDRLASRATLKALWCVQHDAKVSDGLDTRLRSTHDTALLLVCPTEGGVAENIVSRFSQHANPLAMGIPLPVISDHPSANAAPNNMECDIILLSNSAFPPDTSLLSRHVQPLLKKLRLPPLQFPPHWTNPELKQALHTRFNKKWEQSATQARNWGHKWNYTQWAKHLDVRNQDLHNGPEAWLRKFANFGKPHSSTNTVGTWIYCVYCARTGQCYVGQTGGRGTLKSVVNRFLQHRRSALSYATLYGGKQCKNIGKNYPMMTKIPIEKWGVLVPEACPPSKANERERFWIRKLSPTLNVRDVPTFSKKWELLLRATIAISDPDRKPTSQAVHELLGGLGKKVSLPKEVPPRYCKPNFPKGPEPHPEALPPDCTTTPCPASTTTQGH